MLVPWGFQCFSGIVEFSQAGQGRSKEARQEPWELRSGVTKATVGFFYRATNSLVHYNPSFTSKNRQFLILQSLCVCVM